MLPGGKKRATREWVAQACKWCHLKFDRIGGNPLGQLVIACVAPLGVNRARYQRLTALVVEGRFRTTTDDYLRVRLISEPKPGADISFQSIPDNTRIVCTCK